MKTERTQFINPFLDKSFKRIFGQDANKSLLIDFLNNLLVGERHIVDLVYRDKEQVPESKEGHSTIYDICCQTDTGDYIIVEMQNRNEPLFINRTVYYTAQAIERQGRIANDWHYDIKAVYCIAFMNFTNPQLEPKVRVDAAICDIKTGKQISGLLRFVYLQLPLFKKTADECETFFERWLFVLKNMDILNELPKAFQCEAFKKLKEVTDIASMTEEERITYENTLRNYRDAIMTIESSKNEGRAEERKKAHAEMLETARFMKSAGIAVEDIKKHTTGLTDEEIAAL
jgi:predicted transposase/invertase (TIGR01784 family)